MNILHFFKTQAWQAAEIGRLEYQVDSLSWSGVDWELKAGVRQRTIMHLEQQVAKLEQQAREYRNSIRSYKAAATRRANNDKQ